MDDSTLTDEVVNELVWGTAVEPDNIGVTVHDGAVTLSGYVSTFDESPNRSRRRFAKAA